MPLTFSIAPGSPAPIYKQIVDQVCTAVLSGRLAENEGLPSVRALADQLLVNPNTVARAYAELGREGIVETRSGKGVFVAPRRHPYTKTERERRIEPALNAFVAEALLLGFSPEEIIEQVDEKAKQLSPNRRLPKGGAR